jgi:hypothetical protein
MDKIAFGDRARRGYHDLRFVGEQQRYYEDRAQACHGMFSCARSPV